MTPKEAQQLQIALASSVVREDCSQGVEWVAGVDVHYPEKGLARAAAVLFHYPDLIQESVQVIEEDVAFPYVPGLLSFREAPAALRALGALPRRPGLVMVDGQGIAHPRRLGLASHLGLWLDVPTIGCAKSRLIGEADKPGTEAGAWSPLVDKGETIGAVLRTRTGVKPLYVSIGHRVDLDAAIQWVLGCCKGYRLPEPARWAHRAASGERS